MSDMIPQDYVDLEEDIKAIRAVFTENGDIHEKHQNALDAIKRFSRVRATANGIDPWENMKMTGRRETYNWILDLTEYSDSKRERLREKIKGLEEIADGRGSSSSGDSSGDD